MESLSFIHAKYIIFAVFVVSAFYIHLRGRVRHGFVRQITDHSTFLAPFNVFIYLFSYVPPRPYLSLTHFPELRMLTDNWQAIREEGLQLLDKGYVCTAVNHNDLGFHTFFHKGWKRFYLKWYDTPLPSAQRLCPHTIKLLENVPSVHGAMFALLPPGGRLSQHRDPWAGSLRYHLGLCTPNNDNCWIKVDGERKSWRDGEAMLFDETYVHEAKNESDTNRLILFCDVERPMRGWLATAFNHFIIRHIMKITATQNMEGEPVGFANRIFPPIYHARMAFKRLKQWNRKVYYGLKYMALCTLFLLFLLNK
jgi:beta-hydroxylase